MGNLTLTPQFVDYSNGVPWSSISASAQTAVSQLCTDLSNGFALWGVSDRTYIIQFGLNAVGSSSADTTGSTGPVGGGAGSSFYATFFTSYATYRSTLQAIGSPNTDQNNAWHNFLPASDPFSSGSINMNAALASASGVQDFANTTIGCSGINSTFATNYDQNGLGAGSFYGVFAHEVTEVLGRIADGVPSGNGMSPMDWFVWKGAGTRYASSSDTRWVSQDGGTTQIEGLTHTGGDPGDADGAQAADAFNAIGPNSVSVSRNATTPLQTYNWRVMSLLGYKLTASGLSWAGLSTGPTGPVGTLQFRR